MSAPRSGPAATTPTPTLLLAVIPAKAGIHPARERDMRGFPLSRE
jgi:hypothetical protein